VIHDTADAAFSAAFATSPSWVRIAGPAEQVDPFVERLTSWRTVYRWEFDVNDVRTVAVCVERAS